MAGKKSHRKNYHPPAPAPPKVEINEEELLDQCLQMHELLKDRTNRLRQLETGDFCYILSTKWLRDWKDYVAYEQTLGEDSDQKHKDKHFGRRSPGKMNSDLLASASEVRQFYVLPPEMKDYDFLGQIINEKKEKDNDYIAVTQDIWFGFLQFYEGQAIRRPIRKTKGTVYYDSDPLRLDTIIVNLQNQQLEQTIKKTPKKLYNSVFPNDKMLLPNLWGYKELYTFFQEYCKHEYGFDNIRIWKGFSYTATHPIVQELTESIKNKQYRVKGRLITAEKYGQKDIDSYLKNTYTLIVQIGEALKQDKEDDKIFGYCEECIKKTNLNVKCACEEVVYCSNKCKVDDQTFHYGTCPIAFDSDDDEEYQKISTSAIPKAGLDNLGNTCYMNSTLQALFSVDHLREFFTSNLFLKHLDDKQLKQNNCMMVRKFSKSLKQLTEQEISYSPWALKGQIDYNLSPFKGYKQHDANDFLVNLLNTLNDYLSKHQDKPFNQVLEPFVGEFHSKVICPHCNVKSQNNEIFMQLSLPVKSKAKVQTYAYAVAESASRVVRGRANLQETWPEMKKYLKVPPETLVFSTKEPEGLIMVDEDEKTPEKAIKGLKGQLVFFKNLPPVQNEYIFVASLVTTKVICGSKMKSSYGSPTLISVNDITTTLGTLWLKLIKTYFFKEGAIVEEAQKMQQDYYSQITQAIQKDNEQRLKSPAEQATKASEKEEAEQPQQPQSELCKKVVQHFNQKLKQLSERIGIQIYLNHYKRHKNMCPFCNKKCMNCDLPKTFDRSFQDFFKDRYQEVRFEVFLKESIQMEYEQVDLSSNNDPNLQDCLALFSQPEQLDQENAWYCDNCDSMALALKELEVRMFPPVLVIHLNRFKNFQGKKIKNSDPIIYNQFQVFGKQQYRLVGAIIHEGTIDAGHYWSICLRDNQYYVFNDSKVAAVEKVFHRNAYILIYSQLNFKV